ncbi:MAG: S9 family peptidase [Myxococcota bacterium]|jgi:dipeptidyl aminopeptidase/acylaminoacyl peptidase|nr:S9 family peptidase [Myxococcota bacterium]
MRLAIIGVFFVLMLVSAMAQAGPAKPRPITADDLVTMPRLSGLEVAPSGRVGAFVVSRGDIGANKNVSAIWIVDFADKKVRQITSGSNRDYAPRFLSDERLAFLSTRSGAPQVWAIELAGGEAKKLMDLPVEIENFLPSPDGKSLAVVARVYPDCKTMACNKERAEKKEGDKVKARRYAKLPVRLWDRWLNETRGHVLWVSLEGGEPRDLTPGDINTPPLDLGGDMDLSISPDGKEVALVANATANPEWNTNNDVFVVPTSGGAPKNITVANQACDAEPEYSPDGRYIAYLAMARPGFEADRRVLTLYERATGKVKPLTGKLDLTVSQFSFRGDSREIVFNTYERGQKPVYRISVPSGIASRMVGERTNLVPRYFQGSRIAMLQQSASSAEELVVTSETSANIERISSFQQGILANLALGAVEEFEFEGGGRDKVHGFMIKPPGFVSTKKYPLLMLIHGGPQGAFGNDFHPRWNLQMFAATGFVVAAINFHGSVGYGQDFCDSVSGDWGGKPYEDIMKGVDYLVSKNSFINGKNVSAAGASYGGFMINWLLTHTDRFRSFVSHSGVYDQISMYGATEELWFPEWEQKGTPWTNEKMYRENSPSTFAKKMKTPTLVVTGEHDYRVPYTQSLQLFTALQRQGVESELLFFPDETHFVRKPQNARLWWTTVMGWLGRHAGMK